MVIDVVRKMIAEQLEIDIDGITAESTFIDLEADSLDILQIAMGLEQEYDITFSDESIIAIKSVQDVVSYIESNKK